MLVAVEPSGDSLGAALAAALRRRLGRGLRLVGVGGPLMAAQGLASPFDPSALAVVGVFNALAAYPEVLRRARETAAIAGAQQPDAAVLIDAWGFNLRVAHRLRGVVPSLPLIKYVAPQVWATRPGRARTLARTVDCLLTIHSFDAPWFEAEGLPTTFVGNPALNRDFSTADPEGFRAAIGAGPADRILLVLPGSRAGEVDRLTPVFGEAVRRLTAERPDLRVALGVADGMADRVKARLASWPRRPHLVEGEAARVSAMRAATVALACSGTVTTELALAGCPMVVGYKLGPLTHPVAKVLIRTRYITLFNVAAQAFVAPERVQGACRGDVLAADLARLLDDAPAREAQVAAQTAALEIMRGGVVDPIGAAADAVVSILSRGPR
ncbi:MAG: lpxB [Caulobacteraceae bacterium]|nr:lpxB [Caulobacteraceae bacterium]